MVRSDRSNDFGPAHVRWRTLLNGAADRFQHHISGMENSALVTVIESHRTKSPLHHHLAEANIAGFQRNVGHAMDRHAR